MYAFICYIYKEMLEYRKKLTKVFYRAGCGNWACG